MGEEKVRRKRSERRRGVKGEVCISLERRLRSGRLTNHLASPTSSVCRLAVSWFAGVNEMKI